MLESFLNALRSAKIPQFLGIEKTDLASWPGKTTAERVENSYDKIKRVENSYDKIKSLKSLHEFKPEDSAIRRRIGNIHKRLLLLLRQARSGPVVRSTSARPAAN